MIMNFRGWDREKKQGGHEHHLTPCKVESGPNNEVKYRPCPTNAPFEWIHEPNGEGTWKWKTYAFVEQLALNGNFLVEISLNDDEYSRISKEWLKFGKWSSVADVISDTFMKDGGRNISYLVVDGNERENLTRVEETTKFENLIAQLIRLVDPIKAIKLMSECILDAFRDMDKKDKRKWPSLFFRLNSQLIGGLKKGK